MYKDMTTYHRLMNLNLALQFHCFAKVSVCHKLTGLHITYSDYTNGVNYFQPF